MQRRENNNRGFRSLHQSLASTLATLVTRFSLLLLALIGGQAFGQTNIPSSKEFSSLAQPSIPDEENAAVYFQKAASLLVRSNQPGFGIGRMSAYGPLTHSESNQLAVLIDRNSAAFAEYRKAVSLRKSAYPAASSKHLYPELPHISEVCLIPSVILYYCTVGYAAQRKEEQAVETTVFGLALAQSLESDMHLISQYVRTRCLGQTIRGIEELVNRISLSSKSLATLQERLRLLEQQESSGAPFSRALVADASRVSSPSITDMSPLTNSVDHQWGENLYRQILPLWAAPYPVRWKTTKFARAQAEQAKSRELTESSKIANWVAGNLEGEAIALIELRLARIGIALEQYRLDHHGAYPPFLGHLAPKYLDRVPLDPLTGKPLLYRKQGRGYTAWSSSNTNFFYKTELKFMVVSAPE